MNINWKLTLTKGLVIGALATLGIWAADAQGMQVAGSVPPWAAGCAVLAIEALRDFLKTRFEVQ